MALRKLMIRDLDVAGKRVFTRVDFNVPIENGVMTDDTRIRAAVSTIKRLRENGARVVLASHLGRPKGQRAPDASLELVADRLSQLLGEHVPLAPDCVGDEVADAIDAMKDGDVLMLENLRFHAGEEANDPEFAAALALCADVYVNDAFGAAHRAHASTVGVPSVVQPAAAGLLMERELQYLGSAMHDPPRPFYAILGGAKVSDKIGVIQKLMEVADAILIGGAMAYTFLVALGRSVGDSRVEEDKLDMARDLIIRSMKEKTPLYLPIDHVIAEEFSPDAKPSVALRDTIPDGWEALDIGPATLEMYSIILQRAKMVIWNGPLGVYEFDAFAQGTLGIARTLSKLKATTIIGGGDCVAAVHKAGVAGQMAHISTGGGASLEFLEGKTLPGVAALTDKA